MDLVTREWKRLHNEELYDMCSSPHIVRVTKSRRCAQGLALLGSEVAGSVHPRFYLRKPKGKTPIGRPRHRGEDNIKMDLQEFG